MAVSNVLQNLLKKKQCIHLLCRFPSASDPEGLCGFLLVEF